MRISPLIQKTFFDVADWDVDAEFGVFPQGARAKDAVIAPALPPESILVPNKRYLFKRSEKRYPDQFWGEVVAYRIGCLLGVDVPPAFAAYNSRSGYCAALIEWFYSDGSELFVMAGDFLQKIQPDFDRKRGAQHNLYTNSVLMRALSQSSSLTSDWRQWWIDALLFDALIGNTDRHQDNWGVIFFLEGVETRCRLSPLFDNGTSLGHERFPKNVQNWSDAEIMRYAQNGKHHVKWSLAEQPVINGHFKLLERAVATWPGTRELARARLDFTQKELIESLSDLSSITLPVPLLPERFAFMLRLLSYRLQILKSLLQ